MFNPLTPIITADQSNTFDPAMAAVTAGFSTLMVHTAEGREKVPYNFRKVDAPEFGLTGDPEAKGGFNAATDDPAEMLRWLSWADSRPAGRKPLNAGLQVGAPLPVYPDGSTGTLAVIDLDTEAAVEAWQALAADHGEDAPGLTVLSPGKRGADGNWIHRGGGHVYLRVRDDSGVQLGLLRATETLGSPDTAAADGIDAKLHDTLVLMPPSDRAEGPYTWADGAAIADMPAWLVAELVGRHREKKVKTRPISRGASNAMQRWEQREENAWEALLPEAGYEDSGEQDSCGCEIWTRPGASSARSAVAHDDGCRAQLWDDSGLPPLHLYSTGDIDTPIGLMAEAMGRATLTKLEVAAAVRVEPTADGVRQIYRGRLAAAVAAERLDPLRVGERVARVPRGRRDWGAEPTSPSPSPRVPTKRFDPFAAARQQQPTEPAPTPSPEPSLSPSPSPSLSFAGPVGLTPAQRAQRRW